MRQGRWIMRSYMSGEIGETLKFFVPDSAGIRTKRDIAKEITRREKMLKRRMTRKLARDINANFPAGTGVHLTLTYDDAHIPAGADENEVRAAAAHQLRLCLRRARRKMNGKELRYIAVTSDMDGDSGEIVRVHHHMVTDAAGAQAILAAWNAGGTDAEQLKRRQQDYTALAGYFVEQVRDQPGEASYIRSRNLKTPKAVDRECSRGDFPRTPRGYHQIGCEQTANGEFMYIKFARNMQDRE